MAHSGQTPGLRNLRRPIPLIVGWEQMIKIFKPFIHDTLIKCRLAPSLFDKNSIFWQSKLRAKTLTVVFSQSTFWSK